MTNSYRNLSDQALIAAYQRGDNDALNALIHRHKDRLYTAIYLLVRDVHLAEDIFQDTFIKIIDTLRADKYLEKGKFLPWAMRIAHNLCVDYFRRTRRSPLMRSTEEHDVFNFIKLSDTNAEEEMMMRQSHHYVREMLDRLPPEQREVIILRHYADLSFKEIAALTHVSINTALGRMRYGLINLRKMMLEKQICL
ncbi:MAG: sigma-70 family RNA polymerase sigma factor [Thermoflavifilum sp.]|jgi:RNA polymerase sigma factor (sigma-70 family)|uniref:RNA polymerase sigma factor n=1 Tax=Thermoflavifilum sp. TaxID=1968839 RepID=UPI0018A5308D|nr:sigma-70 family RNA polymerase sigma factor [Thermoflavifilum sp.]QOR77023.1 MAG: sigma-70 family RNA polymerase sigma factor [Thermoflavifilum sp.]